VEEVEAVALVVSVREVVALVVSVEVAAARLAAAALEDAGRCLHTV